MEQQTFLENNVYGKLKNHNNGFDDKSIQYFSETDFATVLEKAEYYGIAIYQVMARYKDAAFGVKNHEELRKKATDAKWYLKAFSTFKKQQAGMLYAATYKVSNKLLAKAK